jgi:SAM-dependent methyltransferase
MQPCLYSACPACGSKDRKTFTPDATARSRFVDLSRAKYLGHMDRWRLSLELGQCQICGHIWHLEQPDHESLTEMYAAGARRKPRPIPSIPPSALRQMRRLRKLCAALQPRLLDYGSGAGAWIAAARLCGFDAVGYEPSADRARLPGAVNNIAALSGPFDAVNLEQVLEHLPDPVGVLRDLRSLCGPHTLLRISVPNVWSAARKRGFW